MVGILLCLIYFIYIFWLCWVFVAAQAFLCCGEQGVLSSCSAQASHCDGFSCGALGLGLVLQ